MEDAHVGDTSVRLNTCSGREDCLLSATSDEYGTWTEEIDALRADSSMEHGVSDMMFIHVPKLSWLCKPSLTKVPKVSTPPDDIGLFFRRIALSGKL